MKFVTSYLPCTRCMNGSIVESIERNKHGTTTITKPCSNSKCPSRRPNPKTIEYNTFYGRLTLLEKTIHDELIEFGVDISYLPHDAQMFLLKEAKKLASLL